MPELAADLEALVRTWRDPAAKMPVSPEFSRAAGFFAALRLCADQLDETLQRAKYDA